MNSPTCRPSTPRDSLATVCETGWIQVPLLIRAICREHDQGSCLFQLGAMSLVPTNRIRVGGGGTIPNPTAWRTVNLAIDCAAAESMLPARPSLECSYSHCLAAWSFCPVTWSY